MPEAGSTKHEIHPHPSLPRRWGGIQGRGDFHIKYMAASAYRPRLQKLKPPRNRPSLLRIALRGKNHGGCAGHRVLSPLVKGIGFYVHATLTVLVNIFIDHPSGNAHHVRKIDKLPVLGPALFEPSF